ncbi:MAG TPA: type II secretion system minor pseudopilin GspK [Geobacteraceae bacterium]
MRGEGGFALVVTLLVTALLVALSAEFVNEVYVDTSLSHNFVDGQQASILASSGVDGGMALLKFNLALQPNYTTLADQWAKPLNLEDERGKITVTIEEESAKLDLNKMAPATGDLDSAGFYYATAVALVKKLGLSTDLWDALADWVDTNDEPHPGGAESSYYVTLKPPYAARNAPLDSVEELGLVKGFTGEVMAKLLPFVTVYGESSSTMAAAPVNINTAPKELLASLQVGSTAMTDSLAEQVIEYRKTTPFKNPQDLANVPGMGAVAIGLQTYVTTKGSVFRIRSEARVRETRRVVEAVVRMSGTTPAVLYWREY